MATAWLLLLRHGQSTWNAEGRWQGWADPPLSPLGEQQALDAAVRLRDAGLSAAVSSDLARARRTAELMSAQLGLGDVVVFPDMRERNVGVFQGHTIDEILERWPELFDGAGRLTGVAPDAEPVEQLVGRVVPVMTGLARRFEDERVLVVTHGGVLRSLERHLGVEPPPRTLNLAGRWFEVCDGGPIVAGELVVPLEPEIATAPTTE